MKEIIMPTDEQIYNWIKQLVAETEDERQSAEKSLIAMGTGAVPHLKSARGRPAYPKTEALRVLGVIGDTCSGKTKKTIVETMEYVMKSTSASIPPEEKTIAQEALERWGKEVPQPKPPKIVKCYKCKRPSTEVRVSRCYLPDCSKIVCEDHAAIIEGGMGTWFCCEEHKKQAMQNPSILM